MAAAPDDPLGVLTIDKPEQLKALGHPLRLRVLELLGLVEREDVQERLGLGGGHAGCIHRTP